MGLVHAILSPKHQAFINGHLDADPAEILLKSNAELSVEVQILVEQIEAKKRSAHKLPTWFNTPNIYYPNKLNIAQTSSETTAKYKAGLVSGETLLDLTGGFGVDSYFFSKFFEHVTHCEVDDHLSAIAAHNFAVLGADNVQSLALDGLDFLFKSKLFFDCIYIDPARRDASKKRVFLLEDCLPNVPENMELLWRHTRKILLKTAPLLDISIGIKTLKTVKAIHIVSVQNEVKELLWDLSPNHSSNPTVFTINFNKENVQEFQFIWNDKALAKARYSPPKRYLFEPNATIMKSGGFNLISDRFDVYKLHPNTHLYTADRLIDFPGRCFEIKKVLGYHKNNYKNLMGTKANISSRNFPLGPEDIKKKLKLRDGGNSYWFFTSDLDEKKIILVCAKINKPKLGI